MIRWKEFKILPTDICSFEIHLPSCWIILFNEESTLIRTATFFRLFEPAKLVSEFWSAKKLVWLICIIRMLIQPWRFIHSISEDIRWEDSFDQSMRVRRFNPSSWRRLCNAKVKLIFYVAFYSVTESSDSLDTHNNFCCSFEDSIDRK